uniref:Oxysterol-binding protein n=1 Tax=Dendroctonus ponderosae TaxID=77166 RepID=A0AAR5Q6X2_DENPD
MASSDKKSPEFTRVKLKALNSTTQVSDSDASLETNSLSADSGTEQNHTVQNEARKKRNRKGSEWEIMEGLKDGQRFEIKPNLFSGYLHKKRKWPLKGWHKRYFILDKGILVYGKNPIDIKKGKIHGTLDIGLSVITTKACRRRIDIDAEEFIYHLKAKTDDIFTGWIQQLTAHRLYRQHIITYGTNVGSLFSATDGMHGISIGADIVSKDGSLSRKSKRSNAGRLELWVQESDSTLEKIQRNSCEIERNLEKMSLLLQQLESIAPLENIEAASPSVKKDRRKFGLRKKKTKTNSVDLSIQFSKTAVVPEAENTSPLSANSFSMLSVSHQHINTLSSSLPVSAQAQPDSFTCDSISNSDAISLPVDAQLKDEFIILGKSVLGDLKTMIESISKERERLKVALDAEPCDVFNSTSNNQSSISLKDDLSKILQQNLDLKTRLLKIHEASNLEEAAGLDQLKEKGQHCNSSLSYSSSYVSATDFFDAEDLTADKTAIFQRGDDEKDEESEVRTRSESSSEADSFSSGEGSVSSESELGTELHNTTVALLDTGELIDRSLTGRRTTLPVPRPHTGGLSLWNLLSKNIGKDLSQVSMPVALNEPLNALQRLCEELEYSELLDRAANTEDPYERMVLVAAFAVSAYASTSSRAGNKPFNPLLGETYECIREDRGFKFIAEQVSHHPPISTCYAESANFTFWQDARIKTKFWGKSMEFQPVGYVRVQLPKTGDLYTWNKVTTCVHNLFSNQRWVDQYGELKIENGKISCKLTFYKASYWSSKRHEIVGAVYDEAGKPVRRLFGKWSESLYCGVAPSARCIWRAGNLPENQELYYGFTRFAIELNELGPNAALLPPTDTRFRPDQRALEEGDLNTAEALKLQLENAQRERRKRREELHHHYEPRWFSNPGKDVWEYNGKYWELRDKPGFGNLQFESLW